VTPSTARKKRKTRRRRRKRRIHKSPVIQNHQVIDFLESNRYFVSGINIQNCIPSQRVRGYFTCCSQPSSVIMKKLQSVARWVGEDSSLSNLMNRRTINKG
jgi:hypothetical protein